MRGGVVEGFDEGGGGVVGGAGQGEAGGVDREKELRDAGFGVGVGGELVGGVAAGKGGGEEVEDEGEAGALPETDGEGAVGLLDGSGVAGEVAFGVVPAGHGELLSAAAVAGELAVGELAHGDVKNDVRRSGVGAVGVGARDSEDEGVVAEGGCGGAPGGEVGAGVGPADSKEALVGGLPAVGAAAHPVVGVGEADGSEAVLPGEGDGAGGRVLGVEGTGAELAVPALDGAIGRYEGGSGVDVDEAVADGVDEVREAVEAV